MFQQCDARITQAYDKHTRTWDAFEISVTEYAKEIVLINLPSHRRRDRKSKITPFEMSQLRALNGQLLSVGYAMFAAITGTTVAVDGTKTASHCGYDS